MAGVRFGWHTKLATGAARAVRCVPYRTQFDLSGADPGMHMRVDGPSLQEQARACRSACTQAATIARTE